MTTRNLFYITAAAIVAIFVGFTGCERDLDVLEPATFPKDPEVFLDGFSSGLNYTAFGGSKVDAFDVDTEVKYKGTKSMRIAVPNFDDPEGAYAGGSYFTTVGRDLTDYDALTFWAKASKGATLDVVGFGNDLGASKFNTTRSGLILNTNWKKYIIPIPLASKLTAERGMFYYSEGPEDNLGYTIWFDEVQFEKLGTVAHPRPAILNQQNQIIPTQVGANLPIGDIFVLYNLPDGTDQRIDAAPGYFTFTSSDEGVATVDENGVIRAVSLGSATVTAMLGEVEAEGSLTVNVEEAPPGPTEAAPTPTVDPGNVISLFSNAYTNVPVDTWATGWQFSTAVLQEVQIAGDDVKLYTNLNFNGIEFASQTVDASSMNRFHMDIWTPDPTALPAAFNILLVDFGADGTFDGGDDVSHELTFTATTTPSIASETWVGLDVPLSDFTGLITKGHLAQLVISGDPNTVYVDNVYFYNDGGGTSTEPTTPAPTPTVPASNVISMFSNAYTDVTVDTWSAEWDQADVEDVLVTGDDVKLYTNLVFAAVEFLTEEIDASTMTYFHVDIWTPDPTTAPAEFKIKLVNDVFGSISEHELTFNDASSPALATGSWVSFDIPLSDFVNLTGTANLGQLIISSTPNTVYVDNIYFYSEGGTPTEPTVPAPTPTVPAGNVISMFSNAYTNVTLDTWSAEWDQADVEDVLVSGDDVKLYTNLVFAGIEFLTEEIDATSMTYFHMDIWTPDPTAAPAEFKIKLVNDVFGTLSEHELTFNDASSPAMATGSWVSFDIPLSDFVNLAGTANLGQLIISSTPNTVFVDNIYFYSEGGTPTEPTVPAPTPSFNPADVISIFSDAYTNLEGTDFYPDWGQATVVSEVLIEGNNTLLYTGLNYQGIQLVNPQDFSGMSYLHVDFWTANSTDLGIFLISPGPVETEVLLVPPGTTGNWVSVDIPLTEFSPVDLTDVIQFKFEGDGDIYLDNILFHK